MTESTRQLCITGDGNVVGEGNQLTVIKKQYFTGKYERLRDAYIEPWPVFERVNLRHFAGRRWLLDEVDAFLEDHDRGYLVLEAEAGLGKTTFLAWLVQQRGYFHHFTELAPGLEGVKAGLKSLAAQLVLGCHLNPYDAEGIVSSAAVRPDFLFSLLKRASQQLQDGQRVVLIIDALDEAGTPHGQNVLGLPQVLPEGVFVIASQRPVPVALQVDTGLTPRSLSRLSAGSKENRADMRLFLKQAVASRGIARVLNNSQYSVEQFIEALLEKCGGVWMYLHYVLQEIKQGERPSMDLHSLPDGIVQYYARYWQSWRRVDEDKWYGVYLPLLATLAAAREATTPEHLAEWTKTKASVQSLHRLLTEKWRPFLITSEQQDGAHYRLYHASLREFIEGQVDVTDLTESERALAHEMSEAVRRAHGHIADYYVRAWGGLSEGLPNLSEAMTGEIDVQYGLRHLVGHLGKAKRVHILRRVLALEQVQVDREYFWRGGVTGWLDRLLGRRQCRVQKQYENVWYTTKERFGQVSEYMTDVGRAWREAERRSKEAIRCGERASSVGMEVRYGLIVASFNSLAQSIPPVLLEFLVREGVWTQKMGLSYACQVSHPRQRAVALARLAPCLSGELTQEALKAVEAIRPESSRSSALSWLAPHLPDGLLPQAMEAAGEIRHKFYRARALAEVALCLPAAERELFLQELLEAARAVPSRYFKAVAVRELAIHSNIPPDERQRLLTEALTLARNIEYKSIRPRALIELIPHLPESLKAEIIEEALAAARDIEDEYDRVQELNRVAPQLPTGERKAIGREALAAARLVASESRRVVALGVASHLAGSAGDLKDVLRAVRNIDKEASQELALVPLVTRLAELGNHQEALSLMQEISSPMRRIEASEYSLPYLPESLLRRILRSSKWADVRNKAGSELSLRLAKSGRAQEALKSARSIRQVSERVRTLTEMLPHLPSDLKGKTLRKVLKSASRIQGKYKVRALMDIVPYLPAQQRQEVLQQALREVQVPPFRSLRARTGDRMSQKPEEMRIVDRLLRLLAESGYLEQAQALTRVIGDEEDQAETLVELVPYLSVEERQRAAVEALGAIQKIVPKRRRADSLVKLAPYLSATELEKAARALASHYDSALSADKQKKIEKRRPPGTVKRSVAQRGCSQDALEAIQAIEDAVERTKALTGLAAQARGKLRKQAVEEAFFAAQEIENESRRAERLIGLIPYASASLRQQALEKAVAIARATGPQLVRAPLLADLLPHLAGSLREEVLTESVAAASAIRRKTNRLWVLSEIAPYMTSLAETDSHNAYLLWKKILPVLASRTREDLLADLQVLAPLLATLGGSMAAVEAFRAIQDVGRWWP